VIEGKRGYGCSGWRDGCPFVLWGEYKGQKLGEGRIRELIQRRVTLESLSIEGAGPVVLQLLDSGELSEIPVPTGMPRRPVAKSDRSDRPSRRATGRRATRGGDAGDATAPRPDDRAEPRAQRPRKEKDREADGAPGKEKGERLGEVAVGACPLCGSDVVEQPKSFGCRRWKEGCRFAIWKTIAGKAIGVRTAQSLLRQGRTSLLRGFRSKAGNRFEARLKLDGGEVRFDFDPDDRRRPPRSPDSP
jgi:DNA topoisomerase-3